MSVRRLGRYPILPNSFVHCFVLCVWVRVSRPCMLLLVLDVPVSVGLCLCASRVVSFHGAAGLFSFVAAVRCFWCGCRLVFVCPGGLGACGLARSLLVSPPSPLGCLLMFSGPVSVLLVPPSGYLVVSATVRLSYLWHGVSWLIGSCHHSASWQQRLRPCVGLSPLTPCCGVVHVPLAPALRYSPSGDPDSP